MGRSTDSSHRFFPAAFLFSVAFLFRFFPVASRSQVYVSAPLDFYLLQLTTGAVHSIMTLGEWKMIGSLEHALPYYREGTNR